MHTLTVPVSELRTPLLRVQISELSAEIGSEPTYEMETDQLPLRLTDANAAIQCRHQVDRALMCKKCRQNEYSKKSYEKIFKNKTDDQSAAIQLALQQQRELNKVLRKEKNKERQRQRRQEQKRSRIQAVNVSLPSYRASNTSTVVVVKKHIKRALSHIERQDVDIPEIKRVKMQPQSKLLAVSCRVNVVGKGEQIKTLVFKGGASSRAMRMQSSSVKK